MPFGMGFVELALILVVVVFGVVLAARNLPGQERGLGAVVERYRSRRQRGEPPHLLLQRTSPRHWTLADWLLLGAALLSASVASALLAARGR